MGALGHTRTPGRGRLGLRETEFLNPKSVHEGVEALTKLDLVGVTPVKPKLP
jgi:hypothetical protein